MFRVLYHDADGHVPRHVTLHLRRNRRYWGNAAMVAGVGGEVGGRVYRIAQRLPRGRYEYCFRARDRDGWATGEPTEWQEGPAVAPLPAYLTALSAMPTSTGAQITFALSSAAQVQARILNIAGRPVRTLCQVRDCEAGTNTLLWNACSDDGLGVPNGTYLVELTAKAADGAQARALGQLWIAR